MRQAERVGPPSVATAGQICRSTSPIKTKPGQPTSPTATDQRTSENSSQGQTDHSRHWPAYYCKTLTAIRRALSAVGLSETEGGRRAGLADGHIGKLFGVPGPNTRIGTFPILQPLIDLAEMRGVRIEVFCALSDEASALACGPNGLAKARGHLHWRERDRMRALGKKGGRATADGHSAAWLSARGRKGARARKLKRATKVTT